jgi:hypothetical protein
MNKQAKPELIYSKATKKTTTTIAICNIVNEFGESQSEF